MMSKLIRFFALFLPIFFAILLAGTLPAHAQANTFVALCYHDVSNGFVGNTFSLRKKDLITQFDYLKAHYHVVGLQDILNASNSKKNLPAKAVLITVDDGLASFYENIYPLLKEYKFKAVFAIVGKWTEEGLAPDYGFKDSNPKMATWKQLKEMSDSGLVDVVSHSYDMHQGQVFNPQGNQAPVAGYFKYNPATKSYQSDDEFIAHVQADLKKNNDLIKKHVGKDHPVVVWPYGSANELSRKAAENAGLTIQMSLRSGLNNTNNLSHIGRGLMFANMDIAQFASSLEHAFIEHHPLRMVRFDLDSIWKKTEAETEQGLGDLLEQTLALGPSGALLQAMSDSGDAYFSSSKLKMRGDYLNRAAHTMRYRARVSSVYARLPQSILKDPEVAQSAVMDLVKYTDIDGVFFDVSEKEKLKFAFDPLVAAARSVRPYFQFGLIGQRPAKAELFDYVVLTPGQLEKEKANAVTAEHLNPAKVIAAIAKDYKLDGPHMMAQGYANLFYDVNVKGFVPDTEFKNLFSVRHAIPHQTKGEAK